MTDSATPHITYRRSGYAYVDLTRIGSVMKLPNGVWRAEYKGKVINSHLRKDARRAFEEMVKNDR